MNRPTDQTARVRLGSVMAGLLLAIAGCSPASPPTSSSPKASPMPPSPGGTPTSAVRFAAVGDIGDGSERQASVAAAIADAHRQRPLDFLLLLGDLIYPDGDPEEYQRKFARPYRPVLDAGIELRAVLGNHDLETDPAGIVKVFRMPARSYTFVRGPVQFFALDTSTGTVSGEQRRWLQRELARSRAAWKIAFTHVPPYSSGWHGSNPALQQALVDVFDQFDVQLVLASHDHNYERTKPLRGTTYIIAGGGCCPRRAGRESFTARSATGLNFVIVEASAETLKVRAMSADGTLVDDATIVRAGRR